jgi:hypothetical protein
MLGYYYYILYSFFIVSFLYIIIKVYENFIKDIYIKKIIKTPKKISTKSSIKDNDMKTILKKKNTISNILKKKYNINSSEDLQKDINFILKPSILTIYETQNFNIANSIIKNFDILNNNTVPIVKSFVLCKYTFNNLFSNVSCINSFYDFYKNIIKVESKNYNIIIKFYNNDDDYLFIYLDKNTLIKIKNPKGYDEIKNSLSKNNSFIIKDNDNYYMSFGKQINSFINKDIIKKIFFNKIDLDNDNNRKNFNLITKFNKLTIIFWISTKINFN